MAIKKALNAFESRPAAAVCYYRQLIGHTAQCEEPASQSVTQSLLPPVSARSVVKLRVMISLGATSSSTRFAFRQDTGASGGGDSSQCLAAGSLDGKEREREREWQNGND